MKPLTSHFKEQKKETREHRDRRFLRRVPLHWQVLGLWLYLKEAFRILRISLVLWYLSLM